MMPGLKLRDRADRDIDEIADYIARHNVSAGRRFLEAIWDDFAFLLKYPGSGTLRKGVPRHFRGLRSWPVSGFSNYLIFFLPTNKGVEIIRVIHGARRIGPALREA